MVSCDMCGKDSRLVKSLIEGTEMLVCGDCARFGKILNPPDLSRLSKIREGTEIRKEVAELIEDYNKLIKNTREGLGLKQEHLAKKMMVKESIIHQVESGNFTPSYNLAKKFERALKIKLIE